MSDVTKNKDELTQLLKNGFIDEFNQFRSYDKDNLLDLSEIDLGGSEMPGVNLSDTDLTGSDLSECVLIEADFSNSDLTSVDFSRSTLKQVDFSKALLAGTKFNNSVISESNFAETDMNGSDFSEADLTGSDLSTSENLSQCIFDVYTSWPDSDNLPEDFDPEYVEDLSSLKDSDDLFEDDYAY